MSDDKDSKRGSRGELGTGTPSSRLKSLYHKNGFGSFKQFVKEQMKAENPDAKLWFENKKGLHDQKRKPENVSRARLEASATKMSRKKGKN